MSSPNQSGAVWKHDNRGTSGIFFMICRQNVAKQSRRPQAVPGRSSVLKNCRKKSAACHVLKQIAAYRATLYHEEV
jgi:hypothetical protein